MVDNPSAEQQVLDALRRVPLQRWPEVLSYITRFISRTEELRPAAAIRSAADLANSELAGLWSARTDVPDAQAFARQLRQQAEKRRGAEHAPGY